MTSSAYQDFFKYQEDAADGDGTVSVDVMDEDDGVLLVDNVLDCALYTGCEDDDSDEILDCMIENTLQMRPTTTFVSGRQWRNGLRMRVTLLRLLLLMC
jgi:hypothetical protein